MAREVIVLQKQLQKYSFTPDLTTLPTMKNMHKSAGVSWPGKQKGEVLEEAWLVSCYMKSCLYRRQYF